MKAFPSHALAKPPCGLLSCVRRLLCVLENIRLFALGHHLPQLPCSKAPSSSVARFLPKQLRKVNWEIQPAPTDHRLREEGLRLRSPFGHDLAMKEEDQRNLEPLGCHLFSKILPRCSNDSTVIRTTSVNAGPSTAIKVARRSVTGGMSLGNERRPLVWASW